jgi:hypothetical protein
MNNSSGLLMVTKTKPYELWEVYFKNNILRGKKMNNVALEIFDEEVNVPHNVINRLCQNQDLICQVMNDSISKFL